MGQTDTGLALQRFTAAKRKNLLFALVEAVKSHTLAQAAHRVVEGGEGLQRNMWRKSLENRTLS